MNPLPPLKLLSAGFFIRRPSFTFPVETYDDWVVLGCREGSYEFSIGAGPKQMCEAGQFVVCPAHHALHRKSLGTISFYHLRFRWEASMTATWQGVHELIDLARMESTLGHLEKLSDRVLTGATAMWADHLLTDLLLQRLHERETVRTSENKPRDRAMIQAAEKLRAELRSSDSLERLAESMQLTPSQFSRRFTTAFGVPPSEYRTGLRMHEARRLLTETSLNLQDIAEACGYENAFYFTRVFTRETGQPPGQFRKARRV